MVLLAFFHLDCRSRAVGVHGPMDTTTLFVLSPTRTCIFSSRLASSTCNPPLPLYPYPIPIHAYLYPPPAGLLIFLRRYLFSPATPML